MNTTRMDMTKYLAVIDGAASKPATTAITECTAPQGTTATLPPLTMGVSINASGADQIRELISMIATGSQQAKPMEMPTPGLGIVPPVDKVDDIRNLAGLDTPEVKFSVDTDSNDSRLSDDFENATTKPDPTYQDTEYMTKDLAGGLNKEKTMYKKEYPGDNPMAVESLVRQLQQQYQEFKKK